MKICCFPILFILSSLLISCGGDPSKVEVTPKAAPSDKGNEQELRMIQLIRGHPQQKRSRMIHDTRLANVARAKAREMGRRGYFGHKNPEGIGANYRAKAAGYRLPKRYLAFKGSNQIESLAAGRPSAKNTLKQWLSSFGHKSQILALAPFYQSHTRYGIGYAKVPGSKYLHYWVFLSAPPEPSR